ncbi:hypothetical protein ECZU29_00020 [Escherichia coli]|nr:hypothetical protein ECZU29_00020 [Escherichia coli]
MQAANEAATKGFDDQTRRLKENMGTLEHGQDSTGIQIHVGCGAGYIVLIPQEMLIKGRGCV